MGGSLRRLSSGHKNRCSAGRGSRGIRQCIESCNGPGVIPARYLKISTPSAESLTKAYCPPSYSQFPIRKNGAQKYGCAYGASLNGPGFGGAVGNICANVYAFSPDEQLVSCCSCLITPNGLVSLSVDNDLLSNTLTGIIPSSVTVTIIPTLAGPGGTGTNCTNSAALAGTPNFPFKGYRGRGFGPFRLGNKAP